jgi:hypothetical protein
MQQFDKTYGRKYDNNKPKNGGDNNSLCLISYEEWTLIKAYVKSVCHSKPVILLSFIRGSVHCCKKCVVILNLCSMSYVEDHVSWNITNWTYPLVAHTVYDVSCNKSLCHEANCYIWHKILFPLEDLEKRRLEWFSLNVV